MPVTNLQLLNQVHFTGEAQCKGFRPNPLRPNFCTECNKLFDKHRADLIPDDECLLQVRCYIKILSTNVILQFMQALAYSQKAEIIPSTILPLNDKEGGFRGVMNAEFLKDLKVKYVVNTAKGLEIFGPKYLVRTLKYLIDIQSSIFKKCRHTHTYHVHTD